MLAIRRETKRKIPISIPMPSKSLHHAPVGVLLVGCLAFSTAAQQAAPASQTAPTQGQATGGVVLEAETPIHLRVVQAVTSKKAKTGDRVGFQVLDDATVGGLVVIPRHAIAWGTICQAQPSRMLGRGGKLAIELSSVATLTGEQVPLRGSQADKGRAGGIDLWAAATVVFLPVLPFEKGEQAVIPKGTMVTAFVKARVTLDEARLVAENRALEKRLKSPAPRVPGKAVVSVYRVIPPKDAQEAPHEGFMVRLDGNELVRMHENRFVTIQLEPGEHTFTSDEAELKLRLEKNAEYYVKVSYLYEKVSWRGIVVPLPKPFLEVVSSEKGDLEMFPLPMCTRRDIKNRALILVESPPQLLPPQ